MNALRERALVVFSSRHSIYLEIRPFRGDAMYARIVLDSGGVDSNE